MKRNTFVSMVSATIKTNVLRFMGGVTELPSRKGGGSNLVNKVAFSEGRGHASCHLRKRLQQLLLDNYIEG
jgi:hypothetical protein